VSGRHAAPRSFRDGLVLDFLTGAIAGVLLYLGVELVPVLVHFVERATRALAR
jgi:hypothetical protein